jgi:hypothetical protein
MNPNLKNIDDINIYKDFYNDINISDLSKNHEAQIENSNSIINNNLIENALKTLNPFLHDFNANFENSEKDFIAGNIIGFLRSKGFEWIDCILVANYILEINKNENDLPKFFEGITCSVGCADFLSIFLEKNLRHFDNLIVVTDRNDKQTFEVAKNFNIRLFVTDVFYENGNKFDRGSAYNRALKLLKYNDWVSFIDVDIILQKDHKEKFLNYNLNKNIFYGMDRHNIFSQSDREKVINDIDISTSPDCKHEWGFGYFQHFSMKHPVIQKLKNQNSQIYPSSFDVGTSDFLFRKQFGFGAMDESGRWNWDSNFQQKLPWHCYHIGSRGLGMKADTIHY